MKQVNADEVRRLKARLREINRIPIEQIAWVDDSGTPVKVHPDDVSEWHFCGLNNSDFVELIIDGEKDSEGRAVKIIEDGD